jgi:glutathione S-transferase
MLKLCGFAASNYYNKVKLALLEKGIPFEEEKIYPAGGEEFLALSPMGKVPYLRTAAGALAESQAIVEYLEELYPQPALYPAQPMARAKCRELIQVMELYLEWAARRLYPAAYFGGSATEDTRQEVYAALQRGVRAFGRIVRFAPFAAGPTLTYADCAAMVHLPLVTGTTKIIYGQDVLAGLPGLKEYLAMMAGRPHVEAVNNARKAGMEEFLAYRRAKAAAPAPQAAADRSAPAARD